MARGGRVDWKLALRQLNQAILLCRGVDEEEGTLWFLFGLPGNVYFTIEVPSEADQVPYFVPCSRQVAMAMYDDALVCDARTLDVERVVEDLRRRLFEERQSEN